MGSLPPARGKAVLQSVKLSVQRGRTLILDEIPWRVEEGQHWATLGANGSGKTSLLSALTGYLMPTAGEIVVWGKRYGQTDWRELRRRIGLVSSSIRRMMADSEPALLSVISGKYAMIDYWGRVTAAERARALRILKQIECGHLAGRPWLHLSQGEQQRVLVGRALMAQPRLLILDEPCAGLDPAAREHFLQFLERLGRKPNAPTMLLVTHHVEEIMPVFSHVMILKAGRVLAAGLKQTVLTSRQLSDAFNTAIRLRANRQRFTLSVAAAERVVI